jgi:hypothetical protein
VEVVDRGGGCGGRNQYGGPKSKRASIGSSGGMEWVREDRVERTRRERKVEEGSEDD